MQVKDKVFILKTVRYGDADLIVQAFSSRGSRLSLYARSALKSRKRFGGGVLEPTHYVHVLYEDKSGSRNEHPLHTLKEASIIEGFEEVRSSYERIETALHVLQVVADVVREGELDSVELFNLLGNTLRAIGTSEQLERLRIQFEVKLLANQGILPPDEEAEQILVKVPIADHAKVAFEDLTWRQIQSRTRRRLAEYVGREGRPI